MFSRGLFGDAPEVAQRLFTTRDRHRQHAQTELAGQHHTGRRAGGRDRQRHVRLRVGPKMQSSVVHLEPLALVRDRLGLGQQTDDDAHRLLHARAQLVGLDAEHQRVRHQRARPDAEHDPPARQMVEQHHPIRRP